MAGGIERLSDADLSSGSRFGLVRLTHRINASLEKHYWRWAFLFTLIFFACSIVRDLRTTMWFDVTTRSRFDFPRPWVIAR